MREDMDVSDVRPVGDAALDYMVLVSNIGAVYSGTSQSEALRKFNEYVAQSKAPTGRASDEDVVLLKNDQIVKEYTAPDRVSDISPIGDGPFQAIAHFNAHMPVFVSHQKQDPVVLPLLANAKTLE